MNKHDDSFLSAFIRSLRLGDATAEMPWRELAQWGRKTTELSQKTKTPEVEKLVMEFFRAVENIVENGEKQADERWWEQLYAARFGLREAMKATPMENVRILSKASCKNLGLV